MFGPKWTHNLKARDHVSLLLHGTVVRWSHPVLLRYIFRYRSKNSSNDQQKSTSMHLSIRPLSITKIPTERTHIVPTSRTLLSFVVRSMYSFVHARSLGLWPTPAKRTRRPSRRASSSISWQCHSFSGSKTTRGSQKKVRPQLTKRLFDEEYGTVIGARSSDMLVVERLVSLSEEAAYGLLG